MSVSEIFALALLSAFVCSILGWIVGNRRDAGSAGALLGALFGPLGVVVAFALDRRSRCSNCGARYSAMPAPPQVCPHCGDSIAGQIQRDRELEDAERDYIDRVRRRRT